MMTMAEDDTPPSDLHLLLEASKKLHGYLLHTWIGHYLTLIAQNGARWIQRGVTGPDGLPSEESDYSLSFDFDAIDLEKLTYVIGFYMYILSSHKKANYFLMQANDQKRVLYLRGFDYEGAVHVAGPVAAGYASTDTLAFGHQLGELLGANFQVFSALSPRDLYWNTIGAQRYFYGDYDGLVQSCSEPIRFIYLNANHWEADIEQLVDGMDYFVVYVSSITESVLWELDLLKARGRTADATVVFDEEAIENKKVHAGLHEQMKETHGEGVLWAKNEAKQTLSTGELRESLSRSFRVVSPDEFFAGTRELERRIRQAKSPRGAGSREAPLPFRFFPALDADSLQPIYDLHERVDASVRERISSRGITNLPWFLNDVQLKILISLMLGRHDETGRALAVYAAVMDVTRKHLFPADAPGTGLADEVAKRAAELLQEHSDFARYASPTLLGYGESHEFDSRFAEATKEYRQLAASASEAVEGFFLETRRRVSG
jgi:hypothetical protein